MWIFRRRSCLPELRRRDGLLRDQDRGLHASGPEVPGTYTARIGRAKIAPSATGWATVLPVLQEGTPHGGSPQAGWRRPVARDGPGPPGQPGANPTVKGFPEERAQAVPAGTRRPCWSRSPPLRRRSVQPGDLLGRSQSPPPGRKEQVGFLETWWCCQEGASHDLLRPSPRPRSPRGPSRRTPPRPATAPEEARIPGGPAAGPLGAVPEEDPPPAKASGRRLGACFKEPRPGPSGRFLDVRPGHPVGPGSRPRRTRGEGQAAGPSPQRSHHEAPGGP